MNARQKKKKHDLIFYKTCKAYKKDFQTIASFKNFTFAKIINNIRKMQRQPKRRIIAIIKAQEIQQKNARRKKTWMKLRK